MGIAFMKEQKSWHGIQITLKAAKHLYRTRLFKKQEKSPVCCVLRSTEGIIMLTQPDWGFSTF